MQRGLPRVRPGAAVLGQSRAGAAGHVAQAGSAACSSEPAATDDRGPVAIVGAGPAGLECATALAGRSEVVLFDERDAIGGQLAVAAAAPHRHGWRALLEYYENALDRSAGVDAPARRRASARGELDGFEQVVHRGRQRGGPPRSAGHRPRAQRPRRRSSAGDRLHRPRIGPADRRRRLRLVVVRERGRARHCGEGEADHRGDTRGGLVAALPAEGRVQLLARLRGAPLEVRPLTALDAILDGTGARAAERDVRPNRSARRRYGDRRRRTPSA